jgi:hypothetical protein
MKKPIAITLFLTVAIAFAAWAADVKISELPAGTGASATSADVFPYVSYPTKVTKKMTLFDLVNVPIFQTTFVKTADLGTLTEDTSSVLTLTDWTNATVGSPKIEVKQATALQSGYLLSSDWTTFNNKQDALTFTAPLVNTSNVVTCDAASGSQAGCLSSTDWTTFNNKQNALTFGNLTDVGTDGISVTGGTGSVIGSGTSISQHVADSSHNGYLSSTNWSTFNNKANSGANSDITSLSGITGAISTPTYIDMNTSPGAVTVSGGRLYWDSTGTLAIGMNSGTFHQNVGETIFVYGKATDTITAGQLIMRDGVVGASGAIKIKPATSGLTNPNELVGVATQDIALNNFGRVTAFGYLEGINTSGASAGQTWADDDELWYNTSGSGLMTNVKPSAPTQKTSIGKVINAGSGGSGKMFVNLVRGSTLGGTDSNVQLSASPANNSFITYDSALGYWKDATASASTALLDVFTGDSGSGGAKGLVPAPAAGDAAAEKFLKANGSWSAVTSALVNPMTTLGDLIVGGALGVPTRLGIGASGTVLVSNGSTASYASLKGNSTYLKAPTVQKFTSGSGTYTTPTNPSPLYIKVKMAGGGGGGAGGGTASLGTGGTGGNSTFGSSLLTANGGSGGVGNAAGGAGGTVTVNSPAINVHAIAGIQGSAAGTTYQGGHGGVGGGTPLGPGGSTGGSTTAAANVGIAGTTNTGAGGGGAGHLSTGGFSGGGGGAGGYIEAIIASPSATYAYAVGAAGTAGTAGTSGNAGGAGGSGIVIVEEYYQ